MAITVRTLLNNALYLSVADPEFNPVEPSGSQINVAIDRLNLIISAYQEDIPYFTEKELNGVAELNNINASEINLLDYLLGTTVVNLLKVSQKEFSDVARITNLRSIPRYFWHDKFNNRILIYPQAQSNDDKFFVGYTPLLDINNIDEVLPAGITPFYRVFLEYELAQELCNFYTVDWSPQKEATRLKYYEKLVTNSQNKVSSPVKPNLTQRNLPAPWLAYLSGNIPNG